MTDRPGHQPAAADGPRGEPLRVMIDGRPLAGVFEINVGAGFADCSTVTIKLRGHRVPIVDVDQ